MPRLAEWVSDREVIGVVKGISERYFRPIEKGGVFGPSRTVFDKQRPKGFPNAKTLLRQRNLENAADAWAVFIRGLTGLVIPAKPVLQTVAQMHKKGVLPEHRKEQQETERDAELAYAETLNAIPRWRILKRWDHRHKRYRKYGYQLTAELR